MISVGAARYKLATERVLNRWATEKDNHGRSQVWKMNALDEDRKSGRISGVMELFVSEVEETVNLLEKTTLTETIKEQKEQKNRVAVEPLHAYGGDNPTDDSNSTSMSN